MKILKRQLLLFLFLLCLLLSGCSGNESKTSTDINSSEYTTVVDMNTLVSEADDIISDDKSQTITDADSFSLDSIPEFDRTPYVPVNNNIPYFTENDYTTKPFETYSELDSLGRCGVAYANICKELMPTGKREEIGQVKPSGWQTIKYDCVDGKYLYNRCHLIGFQLAGENANEKNLITGTRYMNVDGMLPFENMVADYVKETNNHVLYRVTPVFNGKNLVADGVLMEGWSVEDKGDGICFNVFAYNVQPGVVIRYATGESYEDSGVSIADNNLESKVADTSRGKYILNTNTKKFHYPDCSSVNQITDENKVEFSGKRQDLIDEGYDACGRCKP